MFRLRACLWKAFHRRKCAMVLGSCGFWGGWGGGRRYGKASVRELEARRQWDSLFSCCQPGGGDLHGAALWLMDGYDVFVIDIYSCDRP